jgi:hypothetical protein
MRVLILDEKKCCTLKNCIEEIYQGLYGFIHQRHSKQEDGDSDQSGDRFELLGRIEEEGADLASLG